MAHELNHRAICRWISGCIICGFGAIGCPIRICGPGRICRPCNICCFCTIRCPCNVCCFRCIRGICGRSTVTASVNVQLLFRKLKFIRIHSLQELQLNSPDTRHPWDQHTNACPYPSAIHQRTNAEQALH